MLDLAGKGVELFDDSRLCPNARKSEPEAQLFGYPDVRSGGAVGRARCELVLERRTHEQVTEKPIEQSLAIPHTVCSYLWREHDVVVTSAHDCGATDRPFVRDQNVPILCESDPQGTGEL